MADCDTSPALWIDVEDLYEYASKNSRPSGIQRLAYELCLALASFEKPTSSIRFLRHDSIRRSFRVVDWAEVEALFAELSSGTAGARASGQAQNGSTSAWRRLSALAQNQQAAVQHASTALLTSLLLCRGFFGLARRKRACSRADFAKNVRAGDIVLALGAMWFHPDYSALIEATRKNYGVRFGLLVYDLIPLRRPEWCEPGLIRLFKEFFHSVFPVTDLTLTISMASAADILAYAEKSGLPLRGSPIIIPIGTGFRPAIPSIKYDRVGRQLPEGGFALVVGTLEVRKNHELLVRVWRRLIDELPRDEVPQLVMAGRQGWLVQSLFEQLRMCEFLGGKIVFFNDPTDEELEQLYQRCSFTLFPSFYEGWGLPVTESLAFGQMCLASQATSIPEAGGQLIRYFDPHDESDAYKVVYHYITKPGELEICRKILHSQYRPTSWAETASAVLAAIGGLPTGPDQNAL